MFDSISPINSVRFFVDFLLNIISRSTNKDCLRGKFFVICSEINIEVLLRKLQGMSSIHKHLPSYDPECLMRIKYCSNYDFATH